MNSCLHDLIFSKLISENVKLELITKVLEKISPEMVVENLFLHSTTKEDYVYVLESLPRVGVFKNIKKGFWDSIRTLDERMICEVSNEYIRRAALNALNKREAKAKETEAKVSTKNLEPVELAAINRAYAPADKAKKALIYTNEGNARAMYKEDNKSCAEEEIIR